MTKAYLAHVGFEHDVFISYCRDDNQPVADAQNSRWVDEFHRYLQMRIKVILGTREKLSVWRDTKRVEGNERLDASIPLACQRSAVLVCIVSPSYLNSDWCTRENDVFIERLSSRPNGNDPDRLPIFKVFPVPVERAALPASLSAGTNYSFFDIEPEIRSWSSQCFPRPTTDSDQRFWSRTDHVAWNIATYLKEIGRKELSHQRQSATKPRIKLFVAYSHADGTKVADLMQRLRAQLFASQRFNYELWNACNVLPGDAGSSGIVNAWNDCDMRLLFISPNFLASQSDALPSYLSHSRNRVIAVLLDKVDFQQQELKSIETDQIYHLKTDTNPKAYADCRVDMFRQQFVEGLFRSIEDRLPRHSRSFGLRFAAPRAEAACEDDSERRSEVRVTPGVVTVEPKLEVRREDLVHFSVTSPRLLKPGVSFLLDIWAHLDQHRMEIMQRARDSSGERKIAIHSKGPMKVTKGTVLSVELHIDELLVKESEDTILWEGEIGSATFLVNVPPEVSPGRKHGVAKIRAAGVFVAKLNFLLNVGDSISPTTKLPVRERRPSRAFASYASEDRNDVLKRIHGMQKVAPELDVFLDVASLRSGEDWQQRLKREIVSREILYLFWSVAAANSRWVEWEWRCGLEAHGINFIDPVPLVSPTDVPPPPELSERLHFDDWVLAFMRCEQ